MGRHRERKQAVTRAIGRIFYKPQPGEFILEEPLDLNRD
jgi:hypothetical protein